MKGEPTPRFVERIVIDSVAALKFKMNRNPHTWRTQRPRGERKPDKRSPKHRYVVNSSSSTSQNKESVPKQKGRRQRSERGDKGSTGEDTFAAELEAAKLRSSRALESAHRIARHWTGRDESASGDLGVRTFSRMSISSKFSQRSTDSSPYYRRAAPKVDIVPWYQNKNENEHESRLPDSLPQYSPLVSASSSAKRWDSSASSLNPSRLHRRSSRLDRHEEELMGDIAELDRRLQRLGRS